MHLTPTAFYANQNIYFCDLTRLNENGIYKRILDDNRNYLWQLRKDYRETPYEQPVSQIGYFVMIRQLSASGTINTIVFEADIRESVLNDTTQQFFIYDNRALYLIDNTGVIVSAAEKNMLGQSIQTVEGLSQIPDVGVHPTNEGNYVLRREIPINNWSVVVIVSASALSEYDVLFKTVFVLLFFELILAFLVTTIFFLRLNKRIRKLATSMSNIRHYDHMPTLNDHHRDEIGLLTQCFNGMVYIVRNMINDVRRISEEKRSAEISLLLSQINPHFIYNALESINSKAISHEAYDISKSIVRISRFLRLSLSEGTQMISIGQEFTQIKLYLQIQTDLIKKHFTYTLKYDEAISAVLMPKLLLQPLVENAIIHGIMEKDKDDTCINVSCEQNTNGLTFTVFDNGAGISKDEQEEIMRQRQTDAVPRFFALHNINQRLILKYGEDASLRIESETGKYTKVSFTIPKLT
ncbi:MAG: histidine kinase [Spirochaetales bacterium]|nr:histidine kinase [Spirochaetales bacterium]